jgi:monoamine oxidase
VPTQQKPCRIGIIGGGPGGLMTAYLLQKRVAVPAEIAIFEASPRLGGKIVTRKFDSAPINYEAGAAELYDYSKLGSDPLRELVEELGLTTSPMDGDTVVLGDHILETYGDIRRAFGEPTVTALKRFLRRARNSITPAEYYESDWKKDNACILSRRNFQALLNTLPDEHARKYVQVCVHSDLATEPHKTSAMYGLQNYLMNEPEYMSLYTIHGGIERLPHEIAKRLTARIHLNRPVTRVEKTASNSYRISAKHNGVIVSEEFDYIVAALPNNWIPAIDWAGETLGSAMQRHHAHYDHPAHYLRVSVLFDTPFWRHRLSDSYFMIDAFGGCCVYDESSRTDSGAAGVLGWLLAGEAAETMSNYDDEALIALVLDSLPAELGDPRASFREARVHRWLGSVNGLPGGRTAREPVARHCPEPIEHARVFVVGDYLFDSTLNGVLDSAELVADLIEDVFLGKNIPLPGYSFSGTTTANAQLAGVAAACATSPSST